MVWAMGGYRYTDFARLGIHSGLSITTLLPGLVGYEAAADLLFTGRIFLGAEAKDLNGNGSLAVCMADLCIPLSEEETMSLDGEWLWLLLLRLLRLARVSSEPVAGRLEACVETWEAGR